MYVRKKNEMAVSPVIAVILMVAITVVLAGVLFVWVSTFIRQDEVEDPLMLTASDATTSASYKPGGSTTDFESGEPILRLKEADGKPIDWLKYRLVLEKFGTEEQYDCKVLSINGKPYFEGNLSQVGDNVLIHCPDAVSHFSAGDYVLLTINTGNSMVWKMGDPVQIN